MKVLVTGGAGFIGSHVVDRFVQEGYEVLVVDNLSTGSVQNLHPRARFFHLDIRSPKVEDLIEKERPEVVSHHAAHGVVHRSVEDPLQDAEINIQGTLRILQASVRAGVRKVIYASTGGAIYGEAPHPVDETAPARPISPYGLSKWMGERYLQWFAQAYGLSFTVLRYANVYGPRQVAHGEAGVVSSFLQKLLQGKRPVLFCYSDEPEGMLRDYVFVGDVVEANFLALTRGERAILNIGTGRGIRTLILYRLLLDVLREEGIPIGVDGEEPERKPARPGEIRANVLDSRRAFEVLGWRPRTSFAEGLRQTVQDWLKRVKGAHSPR